ncbi:MAG: YheU family protein [Gammaproteobacteria bacterium]
MSDDLPFNDEPQEPVVIPHTELSADALKGLIESFVLREGTEYGEKDFSLEQKFAHVIRQLEKREAEIVFDPNTESVNIVVVANRARRN